MPKKLSDKQKQDIVKSFTTGESVDQLAEKYEITKATIKRYLKKEIEEKDLKSLKNNTGGNKSANKKVNENNDINNEIIEKKSSEYFGSHTESFIEIAPVNFEIESEAQKDLSSVSISETDLPRIVYMIVDNKIELETKFLKDYPDWEFLSQNDLERKTIEVFFDIKIAKRFCKKDQKVIKVPNTEVFKIVAPILLSRGISRIVCPNKLIAL